MIRVGVLGATGYAGEELVRLLYGHPNVEIKHLISHSQVGEELGAVYKGWRGMGLPALEELDEEQIAKDCDVVFVSLPHGASKTVIPRLYQKGVPVIDFSGDFRYDDPAVYEAWYHDVHTCPELLKESVYGLPELHREKIKTAKLIGNPGCYTTCSILGMAPAIKYGLIDPKSIIVDAKSGATGAGKSLTEQTHFCELDGNVKAYNIGKHRHTSEIEQELSKLNGEPLTISFTPHLLPVKRGIIATCYATLTADVDTEAVYEAYQNMYENEYFVNVYEPGLYPELKHVVGNNRVAIGVLADRRVNRLVVISCLDNLIKGAAGQAVQNMNLMMGLDEKTGLQLPAWSI